MQLFKIPEWFIWATFVGAFLATLYKGSWQARAIVGSQLAQMIYQRIWYCISDICLGGLEDERFWQYLLQDALLLAISLAAALTAKRYWVLWTAAIGLNALVTDVLVAYTPYLTGWAYRWAGFIWTYAILLMALSDVWANLRESRQAAAAGA